jgi:hypothetical protein
MSKRPQPDHEMTTMSRICRELSTLDRSARRRVWSYVSARLETLPVIAAVDGGTEDDGEQHPLFEPPMMPPTLLPYAHD